MTNRFLSREGMAVTTLLLDIDGTLLDSNDAQAQVWKEVLRCHGHHVPYDRLRALIGRGGDKLLAEVVGIDDKSVEGKQISDERRRVFARDYLHKLHPTAGARALLERLRASGFQLVVATSASANELEGLLQQAGVEDLISPSASSSDAEASKSDTDIIKAALRKAQAGADGVVLLGDTPHDIEAGRRAGVRTVALRCGGWWGDGALAGAVRIYDDPADLLRQLARLAARQPLGEAMTLLTPDPCDSASAERETSRERTI